MGARLRIVLLVAVALFGSLSSAATVARAQVHGEPLDDYASLRRACQSLDEGEELTLYEVTVHARDYGLAPYDAEAEVLPVDTRRNLRVLGGVARIFPRGLEPIFFRASRERARELIAAQERGAALRIGFFLGFDGRSGTLCLLRPSTGVSTLRIDPAYVELVSAGGRVLAREDMERLRAYLDDPERQRVPGEGPRAAFEPPVVIEGGPPPASWQRAIAGSPSDALKEAVGACHTEAIARGARPDGRILLRLRVPRSGGAPAAAEVELATVGDAEEAACITRAFTDRLRLPAIRGSGSLELRVPIRLVAD